MRNLNFSSRLTTLVLATGLLAGCNLGVGVARTEHPIAPAATSTSGGETAAVCGTSASGNLTVCFENIHDGQTIELKPGESISVQARASGVVIPGIGLAVDSGDSIPFATNTSGGDPFQSTFTWIPSAGAKSYQLTLQAMMDDKSEVALANVNIQVTGLPIISPTPAPEPGAVDPEIRTTVIETYRQKFGLNLPFPAIAKKFRQGGTDPWVSTAYVGGSLYEVDIYPGGKVESYVDPLAPAKTVDLTKSLFKEPLCKPAGTYAMLVVFLDFGNLSVTKDEVLADLVDGTRMANQAFAAYPSAGPGSAPILKIETTGVVISVPHDLADHRISPAQIRQYTGIDPAGFRWLAQVDLDAASTARMDWGGFEKISYGYAYTGCPAEQTQTNIWMSVAKVDQLTGVDSQLAQTLLTHEVYHLFGLPGSHIWPCTDGPQRDAADICGYQNVPGLLLGWVDTDNDGIPEILDPTPYGMPAP
jgi:hypothetical protein